MAGKVVSVLLSFVRKVPQDLSGDHRRVKSGQILRGSKWVKAQPSSSSSTTSKAKMVV